MNDIVNIHSTPDIILYANDTNVFFHGSSIDVLGSQTNIWLENLSAWLQINMLELNTKKTKYIIFRPKNKLIKQGPLIRFRGEVIERVTSHKFLGVIF